MLWVLVGAAFAAFVRYVSRLTVVYAGFAIVLTALIWIYLAWLIVMIGAQISFYVQNPHYLRTGQVEIRLDQQSCRAPRAQRHDARRSGLPHRQAALDNQLLSRSASMCLERHSAS